MQECLPWRACAPPASQVGSIIIERMISQVGVSSHTPLAVGLVFQSESAVRDYQLARHRPSTIAYMAIMNAIEFDQEMEDIERYLLTNALVTIFIEVNNLTTQKSKIDTDERHFYRTDSGSLTVWTAELKFLLNIFEEVNDLTFEE